MMTNGGTRKLNVLVRGPLPFSPHRCLLFLNLVIGVTFCLVSNGLDDRTFEHGLAEWRKRHPVEVVEDADASEPKESTADSST